LSAQSEEKVKKTEQPKLTTIAVSVENKNELDKMRRGRESFDDIVSRLVNGQFDLFIEFLFIDGELPYLHNAAFQAGTDADSVFYFDGMHPPRPSTPEEITGLMKQPKPSISLSREEVAQLVGFLLHPRDVIITTNPPRREPDHVNHPAVIKLKKFLENQPK
jgi:hypothetical protein